jgi:succinate-semialdehyde dehydrogenase / glutarate-semialdehyde dehydrogenase
MTRFSLQDPDLFRRQAYIGGQWCDADNGATLDVNNPATGEIFGTVPMMGTTETRRAIEAAKRAWGEWRRKPAKDRSALLRKWYELMLANLEDLGKLMTGEQGKPLAEAKGKVAYAASFIEWFAEEAKRVYGDTIPSPWNDRRLVVIKEPIGVCAALTPWNFPAAMSGCTMVAKPATRLHRLAVSNNLGSAVKVPTTASRNSWKSSTFALAVLTTEESIGRKPRTIL